MKSDSIIQDCHCFVNPFLGGICGFFGGRGAPASGGGLSLLVTRRPRLSLAFLPPIPPAPFPGGEGGDFLLSYARGFAPCIPGNRPGTALARPAAVEDSMGGVPPALLARRALAVPGGGLPSLSPAAPAFRFDSAPIPPSPFPAGRGRPRLFYARGFAPCIPGLNPRCTGSTCRCRRLNGGVPPAVAGSVGVSGARRGLAFFVARRSYL